MDWTNFQLEKSNKTLKNTIKTWIWNQKKLEFESLSKKFCSSIKLLCSSIMVESLSKNLVVALGFKGPSRPTQASLGQFFMMRMSQSKFSIPSWYCLKLMMIHLKLKKCSISIYDPIMPSTWQTRNETWGTWTTCFDHQIKRFSIFGSHIANHWYNFNLYFKVDMIASSFDIICPKKIIIFNYCWSIYY